jgi:tetratricopeptide (TPR) repeat protein
MMQSESVEDLLEQGHDQLDRGQYQTGLEVFQQAAELEPRNPQVLYGLGLAWYCLKDYQKSVDYLNKALQSKPSSILALALRGLAYQRLNLIEQATVDFEQAIQIEPQDHEDWHGRGIGFAELQQYEDARVSFNNATKFKPDFYEAWRLHGITLANLGKHKESLNSIERAIQLKPDSHRAWKSHALTLGNLENLENLEKALKSLDKAIAIKPDYAEAWMYYGITLTKLNRHQKAITSFDKAIKFRPDYAEAWMHRGITLANLRRFRDGLDSLNKAIEFKPDYSKAWMHHGITLGKSGGKEEKQKAIASFDKALEIQPDYAEAWMHRGITLTTLGCHEEALTSFDRALEIQPDYKDAEKKRRRPLDALVKSGCYDAVFASWDKIIIIKPDNAEARLKCGYALYKLGRLKEAIESYDEALDIDLNNTEAWYSKGFALYKLGRLEEAVKSYEEALRFDPNYAEAWYNRGNALKSLGKLGDAFESYDQAVKIESNYKDAWYNRSKVLLKLSRYSEALNSYECTLSLAPEDYYAWNGKGNALRSLEQYDEAIHSYKEALCLSNNQDYWSWKDRGLLDYQYLGHYKSALRTWDKGLELLQPETPGCQEGYGVLHHSKGKAHYLEGRKQRNSFEYWEKARESYQEALKLLTREKFPERHLRVLQDLIEVHLGLGQIAEAKELQRVGVDQLRHWLASSQSFGKKKQLALKFAGFKQLTVDIFVQSGELLQALETAEEGKNTCLKWLLWHEDIPTPSYNEIQQLLNPSTAIIYWHLSPAALNTFILKHGELEPVLLPTSTTEDQDQDERPASMRCLQKFESWLSDWNQQYGNYRNTKTKKNKEDHPWVKGMQDKLEELKNQILNIPRLEQELACITQLILIPHRDLHRFPLHALFSESYTITYLPSAQIGLQLLESGARHWESGDTPYLLSVENPKHTNEKTKSGDLSSAEVESEMICQMPMFSNPNRIGSTDATQGQVKAKLQQPHSIFHFTGHGAYNFDHPEESALFLSGTDRLTIKEISSLQLSNYQLVCLSACETALTGNQTITDEYVGLVSGFLRSGVARVVSTLWTVQSQVSILVMVEFYRQLHNGKSEVAALTEATRWLRHLTNRQLADWYKSIQDNLPPDEETVYDFLEDGLSTLYKMSMIKLDEQPYKEYPENPVTSVRG